jgi:hypothetical protein
MQTFLTNLLIGLTTVFAWAPATILLIMPFVGIYTGLVYFNEMDSIRLIGLCLIAVMAVAGYVGLSAVCWTIKLSSKTKLACLLCGFFALLSVISIGYMSNNPLLHVSANIEEIYLFVCPLVFLLLHIFLELKKSRKQ